MSEEYVHVEAFCLMFYQCKECGSTTRTWNSRDGVTPFIMSCVICRVGEMQHIAWEQDKRVVDYVPHRGQYVWIDMPQELRLPIARQRIQNIISTQSHELHIVKQVVEGAVTPEDIAESFHEGEPYLIQWR